MLASDERMTQHSKRRKTTTRFVCAEEKHKYNFIVNLTGCQSFPIEASIALTLQSIKAPESVSRPDLRKYIFQKLFFIPLKELLRITYMLISRFQRVLWTFFTVGKCVSRIKKTGNQHEMSFFLLTSPF
jgi:hypothetical protein